MDFKASYRIQALSKGRVRQLVLRIPMDFENSPEKTGEGDGHGTPPSVKSSSWRITAIIEWKVLH